MLWKPLLLVQFRDGWLSGDLGVAAGFDEVVGSDDLGLLLVEKLADGEGEVVLQGLGVGFDGFVLALFGRFEDAVISGAEFGFEIAPGAVDGS